MYETLEDIRALLGQADESVSLDFKHGQALDPLDDGQRSDLLKIVTAFANAGGGTVIYGISEVRNDGRSIANAIAPVTNQRVTQDRLREIIVSSTDPVLTDFSIRAIPVDGGQVFVISVPQGATAYQNKIDLLYYARVDASSKPMLGYAIRDVMNRRTYPRVLAQLRILRPMVHDDRHSYHVIPILKNEGALTAEHWALQVVVPQELYDAHHDVHGTLRQVATEVVGGMTYVTIELSSEIVPHGVRSRLLPGEQRSLSQSDGFGIIKLEINRELGDRLERCRPPIKFKLYVDNSPTREGVLAYEEWCQW